MKYLVEEEALCRAGILVCDPHCLCLIFSFIRDEQPRVGLAGVCVCASAEGGQWVREGGGFTGNGKQDYREGLQCCLKDKSE